MKGLYKGFLANVVRSVGGALVLAATSEGPLRLEDGS